VVCAGAARLWAAGVGVVSAGAARSGAPSAPHSGLDCARLEYAGTVRSLARTAYGGVAGTWVACAGASRG
jgi:hypothetical protein